MSSPTGGFINLKDERASDLFDYASQFKERVTRCNLCGGSTFTTIAHSDRYGFPVKADGCNGCGLVFLNPRMSRDGYTRFYEDAYRPLVSAYHGREINAQTIQPEQKAYARDLAAFLRPHLPQPLHTLMDVGGSTGVVARHLWREFCATWGGSSVMVLDPAADELAEARDLKGGVAIEVQPGFAEDYDPKDRRFDLVTICQAIDHVLDPMSVLKMARKAIGHKEATTTKGLLFVDIVDFKAVLARKGLNHAIKLDHPYYFTEETIEAYLAVTGFKVKAKNYAPDGVHIGYLCEPVAVRAYYEPEEHTWPAGVFRDVRAAMVKA